MKVSDVMTHRVVTVGSAATVAEAARLMLKHGISGLPVVDRKGGLVGMVTEGDLLRRAESGTERHRPHWLEFILGPGRLAKEYVHTHGRKVAEVMTKDVTTVRENATIDKVVDLDGAPADQAPARHARLQDRRDHQPRQSPPCPGGDADAGRRGR